jgi:UDP-3-O-[3-hydroxymyristoyl] glucosamine N-acyltransferase
MIDQIYTTDRTVFLTGHSAVLHACTIEDEAFVGMGATLLDGVVVEKHSMVGAGSLVKQNTRIPSGEVIYLIMFSSDCFLLNVKIAKFHYLAVVLANVLYTTKMELKA